MANIRIVLHGKAAGNAGVRSAVHTLRQDGHAVDVRVTWVTTRSSRIEYESDDDLNVNLDGEPMTAKRFRVECRERVLPVRLGNSALLQKPVGYS